MYSHPNVLVDRVILIAAVGLMAAGLTFVQIAQPSFSGVQKKLTPQPKPGPSTLAAKPATPTAPQVKTASTTTFVNVRLGKGTTTPVVMKIEPGMIVQLGNESDAKWQSVRYGGKSGFVFKEYLQF